MIIVFKLESNFGGTVSDGAFDNDHYQIKRHGCICHILNLLLGDLHEIFLEKLYNFSYLQSKIKNSATFVRLCENAKKSTKKVPLLFIVLTTQLMWYFSF